ncbi:hypothetical protein N0V84_001569 [Fusarium piperis]|uniref:Uncharacterized protein n=1 Tax=Fusarium piperis TaxID=1435070 RepID=A0A9W9BT79_9HYPO|nr:hypothetical protein N0V84_001569 [Fusarium piperis]
MVKTESIPGLKHEIVDEPVDERLSDSESDIESEVYDLLFQGLSASLYNPRTSRPFASHYKLDSLYNASIYVPDIGLIDMPLKDPQARQLIAKAHPPDIGVDVTTVSSAGKIWELDRDQFDLRSGWKETLLDHVSGVAYTACPEKRSLIQIEVDKLVVYEKGAMYKAHTDADNMKSVIGTIIVSLPSKHEGGHMVFEHGGPQDYLRPKKLVLRSDRGLLPTGLIIPAEVQEVKQALERWLSASPESRKDRYLYWSLDEDYLSAGQYHIQGRDFGRVQLLRAAYSELPIEVFVGTLEAPSRKRVKDTYRIKTLVDVDDHTVARDLPLETFDEERALDPKRISILGLPEIVQVVPHDALASFLKCDGEISPNTLEPLLAFFARSSLRPGVSRSVFYTFLHLCEQPGFTEGISSQTLELALKAFVQFGRFEDFRVASMWDHGTLGLSFFRWLRAWLVASPNEVLERFKNIREEASYIISLCGYPTNQFKFIAQLTPLPASPFADEVETPKPMLDWAQEMIRSCLDGIGDPLVFLEETALPKARGMSKPLPFHLRFLARLWKQTCKGKLPKDGANRIFGEASRWLFETADFAQLSGEMTEPVDQSHLRYKVKSENLTEFIVSLIKQSTELDDLASLFASKIVSDAPRFQATELTSLWMPFLFALPGKLIASKIPFNTPCCQQVCSAVVKSFIDNWVGPEPVDTESQARGSVSCCCSYCTQLNEFLADPSQRTGTLPLARTEREHLKDELRSAGIDCKCKAVPGDNPCTVMIKAPSLQHYENCDAWVHRQWSAHKLLKELEEGYLEKLLGPDYSLFLDLERTVKRPAKPQPVARVKRKASDTDVANLRGEKKNFKITSFFIKK